MQLITTLRTSDCWSTDSSQKCTLYVYVSVCHIGLLIGLQHVVSKLSYATDAIKKLKYATHAREKRNARNRSILASVTFFVCVHCVRCGFLICVASSHEQHALRPLHCVRQLGNQSPFPYANRRFPSCRTQHTQRNGCAVCDAIRKPKYATHACKKNTTHAIHSILCVRCVFRVRALRFFYLCRMTSVCCVGSLETDHPFS